MKKIILITGILIGMCLSSHAQNTAKEVLDSLYFAEPITEEEENILIKTLEYFLNDTTNESPQKFPNQPVGLKMDKIDKIYPKEPFNERIKDIVLSLNNYSSSKDISNLIDSLYELSVEGNNMCLVSCGGIICDVSRTLVYNQLEEALLNDLFYNEIQVNVWNEIVFGYGDSYQLDFEIIHDGKIRSFTFYIINKKIRNITYCWSQIIIHG
jgi:hypothetical protein